MSTQLFEDEATRANTGRNGRGERSPLLSEDAAPETPRLRTLPDDHPSRTHRFSLEGKEGAIIVGLYDDGQPGEVLIVSKKAAPETLERLTEALNAALPYGVPAGPLAEKLAALVEGSDAAPIARHLAVYLTEQFPP